MDTEQLQQLLEQVKVGDINIDEAIQTLRHLPFEDLGFACIDHHRQIRCGFPEVIYCPGKTDEQVLEIFERLAETGNNVLASRAEQKIFDALDASDKFNGIRYEKFARMVVLEQKPIKPSDGFIAIVTAGTADMPVAMEARVTAEMMGQRTEMICDVGVAGLHRLLGHVENLQKANVAIVVAGSAELQDGTILQWLLSNILTASSSAGQRFMIPIMKELI